MSPSQRRYRAARYAKYFRKTPAEVDFYKRRIAELCNQFPAVFNKQFPLPLAIGVHKELEKLTSFTPAEINVILKVWTLRWEYICMAASVGKRYDLDGNQVGYIDEGPLKHYSSVVVRMKPRKLVDFCKRYEAAFRRPALLCIPISMRPELHIVHE